MIFPCVLEMASCSRYLPGQVPQTEAATADIEKLSFGCGGKFDLEVRPYRFDGSYWLVVNIWFIVMVNSGFHRVIINQQQWEYDGYISGWWFWTVDFYDFPEIAGNGTIIPTDEVHHFSEG